MNITPSFHEPVADLILFQDALPQSHSISKVLKTTLILTPPKCMFITDFFLPTSQCNSVWNCLKYIKNLTAKMNSWYSTANMFSWGLPFSVKVSFLYLVHWKSFLVYFFHINKPIPCKSCDQVLLILLL